MKLMYDLTICPIFNKGVEDLYIKTYFQVIFAWYCKFFLVYGLLIY